MAEQWSAVIWPTSEAWPIGRGEPISIAAPGFDTMAEALPFAQQLDARTRGDRKLPVRVYLVKVDGRGRLADGPLCLQARNTNPRAQLWSIKTEPGRVRIERSDANLGDGWEEYAGPIPVAPWAVVTPASAKSGTAEVLRGRRVRCGGKILSEEQHHDCEDGACWGELAALQAIMLHLDIGPRVPLTKLSAAERREQLTRLRAANPHASPWVSACLK